jgi:hypothetical protein
MAARIQAVKMVSSFVTAKTRQTEQRDKRSFAHEGSSAESLLHRGLTKRPFFGGRRSASFGWIFSWELGDDRKAGLAKMGHVGKIRSPRSEIRPTPAAGTSGGRGFQIVGIVRFDGRKGNRGTEPCGSRTGGRAYQPVWTSVRS